MLCDADEQQQPSGGIADIPQGRKVEEEHQQREQKTGQKAQRNGEVLVEIGPTELDDHTAVSAGGGGRCGSSGRF